MSTSFDSLNKKIEQLKQRVTDALWLQDVSKLSRVNRLLIRSAQILIAVVRDLLQGQLSLRAMSLVFTTMIGLFPLLALSFAVLKSLGVHNTLEPTLLTLLDPLGERSVEITSQILSYVDDINVELIGITSVGLLLYIVLDMMRKIESSFNYIWAVKKGRSWASRVSEYLFAVIVSPLLLFLSISITSSVNTNFFERFLANLSYGSFIIGFVAFATPILLMSLAFAFAYGFLPNTRVRFGSAFIGGFVTTIVWKLMGSVFQGYFVSSARESIYLAFATIIAVLLFAYIGWLVALVGSSIAFYHQNPAKARNGRERSMVSAKQHEALALVLAATIIRRFNRSEPAFNEEELADSISGTAVVIEEGLEALEQIGLITRTADDPPLYLPARAVASITIAEVWRALRTRTQEKYEIYESSDEIETVRRFQLDLDAIIEKELGAKKFID